MNTYDILGWFAFDNYPDRFASIDPPTHLAAPVVGQPWPNWTGDSWVVVNYTLPIVPGPHVEPTAWLIDLGPFFDRFGAQLIPILTSTDIVVKAIIQNLTVRKYIDLKRAEVTSSLAYIGSVIPAVTPAMQSSIVNAPVTEEENRLLKKLYF